MTYLVKLKNPVLNAIADDCGLIVVDHNREVTADEIEFFSEEIVRYCMSLCIDKSSSDLIQKRFGLL